MGGESDLQRAYFEAKLAAQADVMDVVRFLDRDDGELVLLDARAGEAYAEEHLPGAISVPVDSAAQLAGDLDPTRQYVVYCWRSTCHLAAKVALELANRGLDVREMNTGWREWKAEGWPTEGPGRAVTRLRRIPAAEGRPVLDGRLVLKVSADDTGDAYTFLRGHTPPGLGPPLHNHELEDETFYVLRGTYEMQCGPAVIRAEQGAALHMPRYTPHTFRNVGDEPAELVELMTPGGLDRYFDAVGHLGPEATDLEARTAIGEAYGISFPSDPGELTEPPAGERRRPITFVAPGDGRRVDIGGHEAVVKVDQRRTRTGCTASSSWSCRPAAASRCLRRAGRSWSSSPARVTVESGDEAVEGEEGDAIAVASAGDEAAATDGRPARFLLFSVG